MHCGTARARRARLVGLDHPGSAESHRRGIQAQVAIGLRPRTNRARRHAAQPIGVRRVAQIQPCGHRQCLAAPRGSRRSAPKPATAARRSLDGAAWRGEGWRCGHLRGSLERSRQRSYDQSAIDLRLRERANQAPRHAARPIGVRRLAAIAPNWRRRGVAASRGWMVAPRAPQCPQRPACGALRGAARDAGAVISRAATWRRRRRAPSLRRPTSAVPAARREPARR